MYFQITFRMFFYRRHSGDIVLYVACRLLACIRAYLSSHVSWNVPVAIQRIPEICPLLLVLIFFTLLFSLTLFGKIKSFVVSDSLFVSLTLLKLLSHFIQTALTQQNRYFSWFNKQLPCMETFSIDDFSKIDSEVFGKISVCHNCFLFIEQVSCGDAPF